ncbi:MAG: putative oxygenase MesX [Pseudomonadota bacterium]
MKPCPPKLADALAETKFHLTQEDTVFDSDYLPAAHTRLTTNFANLARGEDRHENLLKYFEIAEQRLNELMLIAGFHGKYSLKLNIVSAFCAFGNEQPFPVAEMLEATVVDNTTGEQFLGALGNNFSSYVRDHEFNIVLPRLADHGDPNHVPEDFGRLHGLLFKLLFRDYWAGGVLKRRTMMAISVSSRRHYDQLPNEHPVLGKQFDEVPHSSLTTTYFSRMGLIPVFYVPPGGHAPLAIYVRDGDTAGFSATEMASLIAVMETFQRIYRPEIYNTHVRCGSYFEPALNNPHYEKMPIHYDRDEREQLGREQALQTQREFLEPNAEQLDHLLRCYD